VFISRLLWIYSTEKTHLNFLNQINLDDSTKVKTFAEKGRFNILQLSIAINFYLDNNHYDACRLFKSIDKNTFGYDIVNMNFYAHWISRLNDLLDIHNKNNN
jgi:arabinogalactan endo-1,4-beta-galactosidase